MSSAGLTPATAAGTAAAQAIANAVKASGVLVTVEPGDFQAILRRQSQPLVVIAEIGWLKKRLAHLASYKGLAFYSTSLKPLEMPPGTEVVVAKKIWMPG